MIARRIRTGVLLLLAVAFGPAAAPRSLGPQGTEGGIEEGTWEVMYTDADLGVVKGEAIVADGGAITVTVEHPTTGEAHVLRATGARTEGDEYVIELLGKSPHDRRTTGDGLPGRALDALPGGGLRFFSGEAEVGLGVEPRGPSDLDRVELRFKRDDAGDLFGTWRYRADRLTLRDTEGYGRVGEVLTLGDGARFQVGPETWSRPKTVIYGALATTSQTGADGARQYYPYDSRWFDDDGLVEYWRRRLLVVYGKNLPRERGTEVAITDDDPRVDYRLYGLLGDRALGRDGIEGGFIRLGFDRGYEKILKRLPPAERENARKLDAVLVEATVREGVVPGWHTFKLDGRAVRWNLRYSNVRSEVQFARSLGDGQYEASRDFFSPEAVHIEVRLSAGIPVGEVPVLVALDGKIENVAGARTIAAKRVGIERPPAGTRLPTGAPPSPILYRTDPILFYADGPAPAGPSLRVAPGQVVHARVADPGILAGGAALAEARLFGETTGPIIASGAGHWQSADLWPEALRRAASTHGLDTWLGNEAKVVKVFEDFIVSELGNRKLELTLGDHAAMLILRDRFVALMKAKEESFGRFVANDSAVLGFRSMVRSVARNRSFPLTRKEVTAPDGSKQPFELAFDLTAVRRRYGVDEEAASRWAIRATREALESYRGDVLSSMARAERVPDNKLKKLLSLTGHGFDGVARTALPWLMKRTEAGGWEPDRVARAHVLGLRHAAAAVKAQETLSDGEARASLMLATAVVVLPSLYFQSAWIGHLVAHSSMSARTGYVASLGITTVALAVDVADIAWVVSEEIPEFVASRSEVKFSLGAAAVLGGGRLLVAERERKSWASLAAGVLGGGYGFYRGLRQFDEIPDVYQYARWGERYESMQRGAGLMPRFATDGVAGMSTRQRRDVFAFLEDAQHVRRVADYGALSAVQRQGLEAFDALVAARRGASGPLPQWARNLDLRTLNDIAPVIHRADVERLFTRDGDAVRALLRGPDRRDVIELMKYNPFSNAEQIVRRLAEERRRVREPVPQVYETADLTSTDVHRVLMEERGWIFGVASSPIDGGLQATVRTVDAEGDAVGAEFLRGWNPTAGELTFANANMRDVPGMIPNPPVHMLAGHGTPTATYLNLAIMNEAGLRFADPALEVLKLKTVLNTQTNVHLEWLRRVFGNDIPQKGLRQLFSVRYAESSLTQAGYEITRVRIPDLAGFNGTAGLGTHSSVFRPARGEGLEAFFSRFYGRGWRQLNERPIWGVDIYVDVRPIR